MEFDDIHFLRILLKNIIERIEDPLYWVDHSQGKVLFAIHAYLRRINGHCSNMDNIHNCYAYNWRRFTENIKRLYAKKAAKCLRSLIHLYWL